MLKSATVIVGLLAILAGCAPKHGAMTNELRATANVPTPDCVFDALDPFEPHSRITKGAHKGECIDTDLARPVSRLTAEEAAQFGGEPTNEILVANVSHGGKYWVAKVPMDGIVEGIFQLEYFPAPLNIPAGHTQVRIRFRDDKPVVLTTQSGKDKKITQKINDLIISFEAIGQRGYAYNPLTGLKDEYAGVYRVTSLDRSYDHMIIKQNHRVEQWKMNIEMGELKTVFQRFVAMSAARQMTYMYNTVSLNCTNEIIRAIDEGVNYTRREIVQKLLTFPTDTYPNIVRVSLISRGLLPMDKSTDLPELGKDPIGTVIRERLKELSAVD